MSILAVNAGAAYQIESLEGLRYSRFFDSLIRPEALGEIDLDRYDAVLVPCRTAAHRIEPHADRLLAYLSGGGTIVAMGESHSERWLPGISFASVETNFWWWLEPGGDLGTKIASPAHPLFERLGLRDIAWHLHGYFETPTGAEVLITDRQDRAVLYIDEVTTPGRMILTSLDPFFHHGHHFMPATTRFLDGFLAWLAQDLAARRSPRRASPAWRPATSDLHDE